MAVETPKSELHKLREDLDKFKEEVKPGMWVLSWARSIVAAFGLAVLGGLGGGAYWLGCLATEVRHHSEDLAATRKALEKNSEQNARVIELILERFPQRRQSFGVFPQDAKVVKVTDGEITLEVEDPEKRQLVLKVSPELRVTVKGKPGSHLI